MTPEQVFPQAVAVQIIEHGRWPRDGHDRPPADSTQPFCLLPRPGDLISLLIQGTNYLFTVLALVHTPHPGKPDIDLHVQFLAPETAHRLKLHHAAQGTTPEKN